MVEGKHPEPGAQRLNNLIGKHDVQKHFCNTRGVNCIRTINQKRYLLITTILRMPLPNQGAQPQAQDWAPRRKNSDPIRSVLTSFLLDDYTKLMAQLELFWIT